MSTNRKEHVLALVASLRFADPMPYTFHVVEEIRNAMVPILYLQAEYLEEDTFSHRMSKQWTRKWHIADDATDSQIVQTAFKLCLTSAEHRTREAFMYKGVRVFGPHFDVEDLVKLGQDKGQWRGAPGKDFKW